VQNCAQICGQSGHPRRPSAAVWPISISVRALAVKNWPRDNSPVCIGWHRLRREIMSLFTLLRPCLLRVTQGLLVERVIQNRFRKGFWLKGSSKNRFQKGFSSLFTLIRPGLHRVAQAQERDYVVIYVTTALFA